nr:MAG TPA: hypothetical protein [Caudoviricetes sp.]
MPATPFLTVIRHKHGSVNGHFRPVNFGFFIFFSRPFHCAQFTIIIVPIKCTIITSKPCTLNYLILEFIKSYSLVP